MQKLAFALAQEVKGSPTSKVYQFVPYHFGPYSFTMSHELMKLASEGIVNISDTEIALTQEFQTPKLDEGFRMEVDFLSRRFAAVKTDLLVSTIYARYPWYTSKARDRGKRLSEIPTVLPAIFTVGYEGLMLEGLLDLLLQSGIRRLIDVRANPVARQFGFHKATLHRHCRDLDIEYVHIPELGIKSAERSDLGSAASYELLFARYEKETLRTQRAAVDHVGEILAEKPSALMCMEADCKCCHRSRLASTIQSKRNLPIIELRFP